MSTPLPLLLRRTVRFCIPFASPGLDRAAYADLETGPNTFAGGPRTRGLAAYYELEVACRGTTDPHTGYVLNISSIDDAVRTRAVPLLDHAAHSDPARPPALLLPELLEAISPSLRGSVTSITLRITPFYSVSMNISAPDRVVMRQQFSFAASHRLHCPQFSDDDNQLAFGKCNNPHGHNYRLEVAVTVAMDPGGPGIRSGFTLHELERIVDREVIRRFDHTHLNHDTEEFTVINPSVEHIAWVCYELLVGPLADAGARLEPVTVWETEKTACTYPASQPAPPASQPAPPATQPAPPAT